VEKQLSNVAINIKKFRTQNGWTQKQLAEMAGLTSKHISQLENGDSQAGKKVLAKLCEAFGVDEMTMRFGEREEPPQLDADLQLLQDEIARVFEMAKANSPTKKYDYMAKMLKTNAALESESRKSIEG